MDKALLLVANRLDRVNGYPEEADEPTLSLAGAEDRPIAWFVITRKPGNDTPIHEYGDFLQDVVRERIERVDGVSEVSIYGGSEREIRITVKPELLARYRLTVGDVTNALRRANAAISFGLPLANPIRQPGIEKVLLREVNSMEISFASGTCKIDGGGSSSK